MLKFTPPDKNDALSRITVDAVQYRFHFSFNYLEGFWTLGIYDANAEPLVAGIKLVPNYPVNHCFMQFVDLPNGAIVVYTKLDRIGRDDFKDGNAVIYYFTRDELRAYAASREE